MAQKLRALVLHMKVRRRLIGVVHADVDVKEMTGTRPFH
jgi:hypothetical protein